MRMTISVAVAVVIIVVAVIVLLAVDLRAGGSIEKPMIVVFDRFPTDKTLTKALHWQQANTFPLRELVSNGTIKIDTAFKVD